MIELALKYLVGGLMLAIPPLLYALTSSETPPFKLEKIVCMGCRQASTLLVIVSAFLVLANN